MTKFATILAGTLLLFAFLFAFAQTGTTSGSARDEAVDVPRGDASEATVDLVLTVASLNLRALPSGAMSAISGDVGLERRDTLVRDVDPGDPVRVSLRTRSRPGIRFSNRGPSWDLGLNRDLPIRLNVRSEVADATLDLRGTRVHALTAHAEVGRQTIYLPDGDVEAVVGSEVGRVEVFVPRDANVRVTVREGMRVVRADPAFRRAWRGYELTGGGSTIDLQIRSSLGDVVLRTY